MTLVAVSMSVTLTSIDCGSCGGTYAINERYQQQCYEEGKSWHCPYCQMQWGYQGNEITRLRKQLEDAQRREDFLRSNARAEREARERTEKQLSARKAANTRLRNRIKNGVCPCCSRSFSNLHKHMASQHPGFQPEDSA